MSNKCNWLGLTLDSPFVLASLTLFSHVEVNLHSKYFIKCACAGAGAVILPSVNPVSINSSDKYNYVKTRTAVVESGLGSNMGFAVLGPTSPNIVSVNYVASLAQKLQQKHIGVPVIGSIANIGTIEEFSNALVQLVKLPIAGVELNFSCPNALTKEHGTLYSYDVYIDKARQICGELPVSLKLSPSIKLDDINESALSKIQGLTLTNAYIGLMPPNIDSPQTSRFSDSGFWAPTGVYGPQERLLTYFSLYKAHKLAAKFDLDLSCVGGIINPDQAIQALLLGASTIQLSSAIAWKGMASFEQFNTRLETYLKDRNLENVNDIIGESLPYILENADDAAKYLNVEAKRCVGDRCRLCNRCSCVDKLCIAISQNTYDSKPLINKALCSGCGWCELVCPYHAITH